MSADPESVAPIPVPDSDTADDGPTVGRLDPARLTALSAFAVAGVAVVGLVGGVIWGLVVPGVTGVVVAPGRAGALGADTGHRFDAVAMFACIGFVAGVVGGIGTWWVRPIRGSAGALAAALGAVLGAVAAAWTGGVIAGARHPGPADTAVGQFFSSAPTLRLDGPALDSMGGFEFTWAIVVVAPIGALLAYLVSLLAVRRADLGVESGAGPMSKSRRGTQGGELVGDP